MLIGMEYIRLCRSFADSRSRPWLDRPLCRIEKSFLWPWFHLVSRIILRMLSRQNLKVREWNILRIEKKNLSSEIVYLSLFSLFYVWATQPLFYIRFGFKLAGVRLCRVCWNNIKLELKIAQTQINLQKTFLIRCNTWHNHQSRAQTYFKGILERGPKPILYTYQLQ